jgi:hypothetical protein
MRLAALLLACAALACAQLDDNTLTVTVTRTVTAQPDQATLGLNVTTPATAGLDEVLAAFAGLNLAATDLTYFNTLGQSLNWQFSKTLPFSGLKDALAALAATQTTYTFSYYVQGQSSQGAQQSAALCPIPTLLSSAQTQAQQIASAVGVRLGPIVSMARGSATAVAAWFDPNTAVIPVSIVSLLYRPVPVSTAPGCTLTVQFQLQ